MTTDLVVTITDELVAELETSINDSGEMDRTADISNRELQALLSERAELKRDAERYRFWSRTACHEPMKMAKIISHCCTQDDLDAALDQAMQERQE